MQITGKMGTGEHTRHSPYYTPKYVAVAPVVAGECHHGSERYPDRVEVLDGGIYPRLEAKLT